jgi:uncharacterized glyoxalase superfamily protein PhnB
MSNPPPNTQRVVPYLSYKNGRAAIDFIAKAFGFEVRSVMGGPGDSVMHAELGFGDSVVYLGTPPGAKPAGKLPQRNASVLVYVDDVDAHCARARQAGAKIVREPADQFYGDRTYTARDPEGQEWFFHTHLRDVSEAEMQAAIASMPAPQPAPKAARKRKPAKARAAAARARARKPAKRRSAKRKRR